MSNDLLIPPSMRQYFLGFDSLFDRINKLRPVSTFPFYNVRKIEGSYLIELALAGYKKSDLTVEHDKKAGVIRVSGKSENSLDPEAYLARGISTREFVREFAVADGVEIMEARLQDGVLSIQVKNPPELPENKPLQITIN